MVTAFAELRTHVEARLLVVGDGSIDAACRSLVPDELAQHVVFGGSLLDERPDWYASADVYCAPMTTANFERLPEAMTAGKPVLASDIDVFRKVLVRGAAGELLTARDPHCTGRSESL
jgi:phosphatidylinositol alpha-mannosyltransferase